MDPIVLYECVFKIGPQNTTYWTEKESRGKIKLICIPLFVSFTIRLHGLIFRSNTMYVKLHASMIRIPKYISFTYMSIFDGFLVVLSATYFLQDPWFFLSAVKDQLYSFNRSFRRGIALQYQHVKCQSSHLLLCIFFLLILGSNHTCDSLNYCDCMNLSLSNGVNALILAIAPCRNIKGIWQMQ